jgi:hypothetical protein
MDRNVKETPSCLHRCFVPFFEPDLASLGGTFVPAVRITRSARCSAWRGQGLAAHAAPELAGGLEQALQARGGTGALVGAGIAKELLYVGDPISAAEACRIGLANTVVPDGETLAAGQVNSLYVAQAAAILLFEAVRQQRK